MRRVRLLSLLAALGPPLAFACGSSGDDQPRPEADGGTEVDAGGTGLEESGADGSKGGVDGGTGPDGAAGDASGNDCTSTIAVVGGGASAAFVTTWTRGAWATSSLTGSVGAAPGLTWLGTGFVAVTVDATKGFAWTASSGGRWQPFTSFANLSAGDPARDAVALVTVGGMAHLVVQTADTKYVHGEYGTSWDSVSDPVGGDAGAASGPAGASAAAVGGKLVVAHGGTDGNIYTQTFDGAWQKAVSVAGAADKAIRPQVVALGDTDAMVIYARDADQKLAFTTRTGSAWSAPVAIDPTAYTKDPFTAAALSGGRVLLAWHGVDTQKAPSYFAVYSGGAWGKPAPLLANNNPITVGAPQVAAGVCGADALAVYLGEDAKVQLVRLLGTMWSAPETVPGASAVTGAAVAAAP